MTHDEYEAWLLFSELSWKFKNDRWELAHERVVDDN